MEHGISFLYKFDLGNRNINNPGENILSVTSTAEGDFDKSNLLTDSLRHVWRSSAVDDWQEIVIEADLESEVDTFAILGHNFSEDAVVQVQANIADNWVAPPVNITIPWAKYNIVWTTEFGDVYGFYRVRVLDPTNPCGYIEIGRIVGGRALKMVGNEDIIDDFTVTYEDMSKTMKTEGFFRVSTENIIARSLSCSFAKMSSVAGANTNFTELRKLFDYVKITRPFLTILSRGDPGFLSVWGQLKELPSESFTINQYVTRPLKVEEVF